MLVFFFLAQLSLIDDLMKLYSQVSTVGMRAPNMRKSMEKNRKPVLLKTLLASFPMFK